MITEEQRENNRTTSRNWREKNPEKSREYHRLYYLKHKTRMKAQSKRWAAKHPDAMRAAARRYYGRKMGYPEKGES